MANIRLFTMASCSLLLAQNAMAQHSRPNFLILMSDNQCWNHVGIYGDKTVKTPNIDSLARHGVRFNNAYCASPSSTPARAGLLTGQDIWRLEEGANLWGTLPSKYEVLPDILQRHSYRVGYNGKGWNPGDTEKSGRSRNPAGVKYRDFDDFLKNRNDSAWFFWFSSIEPHRPFIERKGDISNIEVPPYLPDNDTVRTDMRDYYYSIEKFDHEVGGYLATLKKYGQLDNTVIIVCSDNGWQMPRGLANLYDAGSRVPLVFYYRQGRLYERALDDFVNLNDIAPTILEMAHIAKPKYYTAKSLVKSLNSPKRSGYADYTRKAVYMGRERHAYARKGGLGYPGRAIRTAHYLLIHNYCPDRWPAGDPPLYGDVDANNLQYNSPTKVYILRHKDEPSVKKYYDYSFAKRREYELYDLRKDPDQLVNVAYNAKYKSVLNLLKKELLDYQRLTGDPRVKSPKTSFWDNTYYYCEPDKNPEPDAENRKALNLQEKYSY